MLAPISGDGLDGSIISDEWYAALDNAFCFFVEGQSIGSDAGVDGGSVEEALYHCEESSSL